MSTDLRALLRAADPADDLPRYPVPRRDLVVERILARPGPGSSWGSPWPRRTALALALAAAVSAGAVVLTRGDSTTVGRLAAPTAAAAALDRLAATVSEPALADGYLHTETRHRDLQSMGSPPEQLFRWWSAITQQEWQGTRCDDELIERTAPISFPTPADRHGFEAWLKIAPWNRDMVAGGTATFRGEQLWDGGSPRNPCERPGSFDGPNPRWAARLPTEPDAFLDVVRAAEPHATQNNLADGVVSLLALPWLTDAQRAAGLRALGLVSGRFQVAGHETVAGIDGIRFVSTEGGIRTETVLAARAPGRLRARATLVEPLLADAVYQGLPAGTVIGDQRLITVSRVSSLP